MVDLKEQSLVEIAESTLKKRREPMDLYQLFDAAVEEKNAVYDDMDRLLNAFYTDITTCAKFVYMGNNTWDLKQHQKSDLWEKDGSFYHEYKEVSDEVMDARIAEQELAEKEHLAMLDARKKAEAEAEAKREAEAELAEQETVPLDQEPIEDVLIEDDLDFDLDDDTEDDDVSEDEETVKTPKDPETDKEYTEEDEEEYNKYMDMYEDEYDK